MKQADASTEPSAPDRITHRIAERGDWRGHVLARMRKLIHAAAARTSP